MAFFQLPYWRLAPFILANALSLKGKVITNILALAVLLIGISGCATSPMYEETSNQISASDPTDSAATNTSTDQHVQIYVVKHDHHSGLILPADSAAIIHPQILSDYRAQTGNDPIMWEYGWADEQYFTASYGNFGLATRALIVPTTSLLHVIGLNRTPETYFKTVKYKKLTIKRHEYLAMLDYIRRSAATDQEGRLTQTIEAPNPDRLFYRSRGEYALFNNCNHWTANALRTAGVDIKPTLMASGIFRQLGGYDFSKP